MSTLAEKTGPSRETLYRTLSDKGTMLRIHDDSVHRMAELAGFDETAVSDCSIGSPGWNRTNDQRINRAKGRK